MLVQFDVAVRDAGHDLGGHLRNLLSGLALEAVRHQPFTDELLGQLLLVLAAGEALGVTVGVEVAGGVGRVDLVHQDDLPVPLAELVLGVHEDEAFLGSNHGSIEERLAEFENAARIVYASTMSKAALDYRKRRGLDERDEQMALLVQRVSGSRYGNHFLPSAAGVGYSTSPYKFGASDGEENSGMLRLVMGLGTAAVDRNQGSYPRIVFCNDPKKKISATAAESHQYSQQVIDAVNTETGAIDGLGISWATSTLPEYQQRQLLSHDYDAESMFLNRGQKRKVFYVSCDGIVNNEQLMNDFKTILRVLQEKYDYPVDIEFTINLSDEGDYRIGPLQCRPLQVTKDSKVVKLPEDPPEKDIFLESVHSSMGMSRSKKVDLLVYVDPVGYYNMPYKEKFAVRTAINAVNWAYRGKGKCLVLMEKRQIIVIGI